MLYVHWNNKSGPANRIGSERARAAAGRAGLQCAVVGEQATASVSSSNEAHELAITSPNSFCPSTALCPPAARALAISGGRVTAAELGSSESPVSLRLRPGDADWKTVPGISILVLP